MLENYFTWKYSQRICTCSFDVVWEHCFINLFLRVISRDSRIHLDCCHLVTIHTPWSYMVICRFLTSKPVILNVTLLSPCGTHYSFIPISKFNSVFLFGSTWDWCRTFGLNYMPRDLFFIFKVLKQFPGIDLSLESSSLCFPSAGIRPVPPCSVISVFLTPSIFIPYIVLWTTFTILLDSH